MKNKLTHNLGMKIGSLVLAVVIWILIQSIADPVIEREFTAKVDITNEDVLTQEDSDYTYTIVSGDTATFTVSGKTSIVSKLTVSDFNVYADMSKLSIVNAVPVEITAKASVDSSVEILSHSNTLQIEIDELVSMEKDVTISTTGSPAEGYAVGTTSSDPSLITISGPKTVLESIDKLVAEVDVSNRSTEFSETVELVLYDSDGEEITADTVNVDLDDSVTVTVQIWETVSIDVDLDFSSVTAADGYLITATAYSPMQITVTASAEDLASSDVIEEGKFTYKIKDSDLLGLTETTERVFLINNYLGDNLKIVDSDVRENGITYKITVEQEVTASWPISTDYIVYRGTVDGLSYALASGAESLSITVVGSEAAINEAKNDSSVTVKVYLDVSDITRAGTFTVPVTASLPDDISLAEDQEVTIVVTREETETEEETEEETQTEEEAQ